jgi:hypothetical protein
MKTMNRKSIVTWLNSKNETKLAEDFDRIYNELEFVDAEGVDAVFYLTLGSKKGPELFREMQCEVSTQFSPEELVY